MFRWIRFNIVGALGFALQSSVLFGLTHSAHPVGYRVATVIAVELAVLHNFIWHQLWTWRGRPSFCAKDTLLRLGKFHLTNGLVSIGGNLALMSIFVGLLRMPILPANLLSVAACSIFNFLLADKIAFSVSQPLAFRASKVRGNQVNTTPS